MTDEPTSHMRMAGVAAPATAKQTPQLKEVMTSVRQHHDHTPALTRTVVLTCKLHQSDPTNLDPAMLVPEIDGATAPILPPDSGRFLNADDLEGMHVILDIGDAPGFRPCPDWEAAMTARMVYRAASVDVRGANPRGIARVNAALGRALADRDDEGVPLSPWAVNK